MSENETGKPDSGISKTGDTPKDASGYSISLSNMNIVERKNLKKCFKIQYYV